jgi:hypothetical protein
VKPEFGGATQNIAYVLADQRLATSQVHRQPTHHAEILKGLFYGAELEVRAVGLVSCLDVAVFAAQVASGRDMENQCLDRGDNTLDLFKLNALVCVSRFAGAQEAKHYQVVQFVPGFVAEQGRHLLVAHHP